ncbi:short chain dehydrogenase/reductase [Podospora appendiculata]|uniref:Short chain dehydrogenase/reductase n=1 Tax=Podospora appendiculata TaxID=314037 RepID=A0AAE0XH92_9PEZI|nr:short chain dehydrogenase/reductase [Podospora appendiculata]
MSALSFSSGLAWLGVLTAVVFAIQAIQTVSISLRPSKLRRYLHTSPDGRPPWVLVTGASDGIGKALSNELAASGFNVVLHGRNRTKLLNVQSELSQAHPARSFRLLIADATQCQPEVFKDIADQLSDLHLTGLVNNVGGGGSGTLFATLDHYTAQNTTEIVNLNALFPTLLVGTLLPTLVQNSPALLMSTGSITDAGVPLVSAYSASKGYLKTLAESLAREVKMAGWDIEVLHLRVGMVTGVAGNKRKPSMFMPRAPVFAKAVLARVGCGSPVVIPYWGHALQTVPLGFMPSWLEDMLIEYSMRDINSVFSSTPAASHEAAKTK